MYQVQYNRKSYTNGKEWLALPEGNGVLCKKEEAKKHLKEFKQQFKKLFGYPCDLKLRLAKVE